MQEYEFIKYQETPEDPYTKALITVRQNLFTKDGKPKSQLLVFGTKDMKNGDKFHAMATHGVMVGGEKKYFKGQRCDSIGDQELLDEFIAQCARTRASPSQASVFEKIHSMDEVAEAQGLPF
jgi:hypothetical protein